MAHILAEDQPDVQRMVTNGILSCARGIGATEYGSKILLAILEKGTNDDSGSRKRFNQSSIVPFEATWASKDTSDAKMIRANAVATGNSVKSLICIKVGIRLPLVHILEGRVAFVVYGKVEGLLLLLR